MYHLYQSEISLSGIRHLTDVTINPLSFNYCPVTSDRLFFSKFDIILTLSLDLVFPTSNKIDKYHSKFFIIASHSNTSDLSCKIYASRGILT